MYRPKVRTNKFNYLHGYTLIEMMIVVAIIGVLVAIAVPSYQKYVRSENRVEAQGTMIQIAQKLSTYKLVNGDYKTTLSNSAIYGASYLPVTGGSPTYNLSLVVDTTGMGWTLTATPTGRQAGDHIIVLNDQGQRCWTPNADCTVSATSGWDLNSSS